jgi:SAM-dependent methyltransferase
MSQDQSQLDARNADFWSTLCGSIQAQQLGVTDSSPASLKKFDDWYFGIYPYLPRYIPFHEMAGKRVLEIGLGYGTVSQRIAESGAIYSGLDISPAAAAMANDRMRQNGLPQGAVCGSALQAPFDDATFDMIISIGCLHHTGNLQRALDEVWRMLKPGGKAVIMVYNALSYRRWRDAGAETAAYFNWFYLGEGSVPAFDPNICAAYDTNTEGVVAPETAFVSAGHLQKMCARFSSFEARLDNILQEPPYQSQTREELLATTIPSLCGLDIYATVIK